MRKSAHERLDARMRTHPHVLLKIGSDERVAHHVRLEGVQTRTRRRLESDLDRAYGVGAYVGELVRRDKDAVELVVADEDRPGGFPVLRTKGRQLGRDLLGAVRRTLGK